MHKKIHALRMIMKFVRTHKVDQPYSWHRANSQFASFMFHAFAFDCTLALISSKENKNQLFFATLNLAPNTASVFTLRITSFLVNIHIEKKFQLYIFRHLDNIPSIYDY